MLKKDNGLFLDSQNTDRKREQNSGKSKEFRRKLTARMPNDKRVI